MCVLSIKVPIRKKSGNLSNDPRICMCVCVCILIAWTQSMALSDCQFLAYDMV